ncbi:MAG: aminomethyl-transferring glycine dehydrogenase subunit GcvPA [Clostridiales bacterium]|nr:aminomethyl-transferring glycine dehydrogenase subunit GcvPA [Clostridiales bacterium]
MGDYIVNTAREQKEMCKALGVEKPSDLFNGLPEKVRLTSPLNIPEGKSEAEVITLLEDMADQNHVFRTCFRGAGAYRRYIPAIVKNVTAKDEFKTAYTPYQPEMSQGILQSIFEYQTMICELTGMDVSNASMYDGASAAAEAVMMCRDRKHKNIYVSEAVNPRMRQVIQTYATAAGVKVETVPAASDNTTDFEALEKMLAEDKEAACFLLQQPNFFGRFEEPAVAEKVVHDAGAKFIMACDPISLAVLKSPGEYGADAAVGEGQQLGLPLGAGGPYIGFLAAKEDMMRKLPGRIVGETTDHDGNRAYVLTLQAREQHIRREKASSNICSNEALCALTASVYMAAMGADGMAQAAENSVSAAHALHDALLAAGMEDETGGDFFNEFVTTSKIPAKEIEKAMLEKGILPGLPLDDRRMLWCATEVNTPEEVARAAGIVKELMEGGAAK